MKVYHVETQKDYDALMVELEEKGHRWLSGYKPTEYNYWEIHKEDSCINILSKYITFIDIEQCKKQYPYTLIIEYKAKGEMKQNIIDWATDVFVAVGLFARYIKFEMKKLTVEADLKEAKSSAKNLIENIDEYLETLKHEFKAGDYVTFDGFNKAVAKIDRIDGNELHGLWYTPKEKNIKQVYLLSGGTLVRLATPEEISEYESALNFHEHGRKPFEVRIGDLIRNKSDGKNFLVKGDTIFLRKQDFIDGKLFFSKTYKEVNEWLENK